VRVDAEIVRDIAAAASGLLNRRLGGPSVYPPLPGFMLLPPVSYGPKVWAEATGADCYRRAIYTFRYRSVPYPVLEAFDAPNGDFSCVRRARSNTPLQALVMLNEPVFFQCAEALAADTLSNGGASDEERIVYAFRRCLSRAPTAEETAELQGLLQRQIARGVPSNDDSAADSGNSPSPISDHGNSAQLAAWTTVARVLLNLDETITKE
jgi:hypothetical protein